jgi:uncharacterized protein DUF1876
MNSSYRGLDEKEFVVRIRVSNNGVVTTAVAELSHGALTLTARGEGRAHPATEMSQVREDLAVGRALSELGRQLRAAAADEYATAVDSIGNPTAAGRSAA